MKRTHSFLKHAQASALVAIMACAPSPGVAVGLELMVGGLLGGSALGAGLGLGLDATTDDLFEDAERVIGRLSSWSDRVNLQVADRLEQVEDILLQGEQSVLNILDVASLRGEDFIDALNAASEERLAQIEGILLNVSAEIRAIENQFFTDLDRVFDRTEALLDQTGELVQIVGCELENAVFSSQAAFKDMLASLGSLQLATENDNLWKIVKGDGEIALNIQIEGSTLVGVDTQIGLLPGQIYRTLEATLLNELETPNITTEEILVIYADLQYLAGKYRCYQRGGASTVLYVRDFVFYGEKYAAWDYIANS